MQTVWVIARREFLGYFRSPIAYVFLCTFLVLMNFLFFRSFFLIGQSDLRPFFMLMPWILLFYVPAISMGKWAEERKQGTLEFLLTQPINDRFVVLGKFLAGLGLLAAALLGTLPLAFTVAALGPLDWGVTLCGYLGLLFLGASYLAIGLLVSSMTKNQITAFIATVVLCFALFILGDPIVTIAIPRALIEPFQYFGLSYHFMSMGRGVLDSRDVIYYFSFVGFFLWLNYRVVVARR